MLKGRRHRGDPTSIKPMNAPRRRHRTGTTAERESEAQRKERWRHHRHANAAELLTASAKLPNHLAPETASAPSRATTSSASIWGRQATILLTTGRPEVGPCPGMVPSWRRVDEQAGHRSPSSL